MEEKDCETTDIVLSIIIISSANAVMSSALKPFCRCTCVVSLSLHYNLPFPGASTSMQGYLVDYRIAIRVAAQQC